MRSQLIDITGVIRKMRGGSQSHLVKGNDGRCYVAKFAGNPQGSRTLINECIGYQLLRMISVATPPLKLLRVSQQVIDEQHFHFEIGSQRVPVRSGVHLGSQCPANPNTKVIFDFLPRKFLTHTVNLEDFAKVFVIDKLLGQADTRQAIFVRERGRGKGDIAFRAYMIDQGGLFGQSRWIFEDAPLHGLFLDRHMYSLFDTRRVCLETIELLQKVNQNDLYNCIRSIPPAWFAEGDHDRLAELFSELVSRIARIDSIVRWQLDELMRGCPSTSTAARKRPVDLRNSQEPIAPEPIALVHR